MKTCLIYQPAGIGDIMFCQGIVKYYINKGYKVIYPLNSNLLYLKDYLAYQNLEFYDKENDFPFKEHYNNSNPTILEGDFVFLNLDMAHNHPTTSGSIMTSKYELVGLDPTIWKDNFTFIRNKEKENWLYYDYLKLTDKEQYILLNNKYGTPPDVSYFPIPDLETNDKVVDMPFVEGTTIMDWVKVIENAKGIVTVDTCIQYIMEKLNLQYHFFYCYTRTGKKDHINKFKINEIFTLPWEYLTPFEQDN